MKLRLIQLSANWCGPCHAMRDFIQEQINPEPGAYFYVDIDEKESIENWGDVISQVSSMRSIPYFVAIDENRKIVGERIQHSQHNIRKFFEDNLYIDKEDE